MLCALALKNVLERRQLASSALSAIMGARPINRATTAEADEEVGGSLLSGVDSQHAVRASSGGLSTLRAATGMPQPVPKPKPKPNGMPKPKPKPKTPRAAN